MKRLTVKLLEQETGGIPYSGIESLKHFFSASIQGITENRMTERKEMHPDLMSPPCFKTDREPGNEPVA